MDLQNMSYQERCKVYDTRWRHLEKIYAEVREDSELLALYSPAHRVITIIQSFDSKLNPEKKGDKFFQRIAAWLEVVDERIAKLEDALHRRRLTEIYNIKL